MDRWSIPPPVFMRLSEGGLDGNNTTLGCTACNSSIYLPRSGVSGSRTRPGSLESPEQWYDHLRQQALCGDERHEPVTVINASTGSLIRRIDFERANPFKSPRYATAARGRVLYLTTIRWSVVIPARCHSWLCNGWGQPRWHPLPPIIIYTWPIRVAIISRPWTAPFHWHQLWPETEYHDGKNQQSKLRGTQRWCICWLLWEFFIPSRHQYLS